MELVGFVSDKILPQSPTFYFIPPIGRQKQNGKFEGTVIFKDFPTAVRFLGILRPKAISAVEMQLMGGNGGLKIVLIVNETAGSVDVRVPFLAGLQSVLPSGFRGGREGALRPQYGILPFGCSRGQSSCNKSSGEAVITAEDITMQLKNDWIDLRNDWIDLRNDWIDLRNDWIDLRNDWIDLRNDWIDLRNGWIDLRNGWIDLRNSWNLRNDWIDLRNDWIDLRNDWIDLRNGWIDLRNDCIDLRNDWIDLRNDWIDLRNDWIDLRNVEIIDESDIHACGLLFWTSLNFPVRHLIQLEIVSSFLEEQEKAFTVLPRRPVLVWSCLICLICIHASKTVLRNADWKSEHSLFLSGLKVNQRNAKLYNNVGHCLETQGKYFEALSYFNTAIRVEPNDIGAYINVGRTQTQLGMYEDAEKAFRKAKDLLPRPPFGEGYEARVAPSHLNVFLNLANLISRMEQDFKKQTSSLLVNKLPQITSMDEIAHKLPSPPPFVPLLLSPKLLIAGGSTRKMGNRKFSEKLSSCTAHSIGFYWPHISERFSLATEIGFESELL
ncbi:protein O-mannosyl-transferase Tmtc3 [Caerostris extrusa]|uniref:Protein O-mannosyl-transferase Tmtc3 n=1 Tax=Caerostris extrusa TaxID=172846 RepID=A0AAV4VRD7_CAEEX|nr:protein O-mannosyl-transferase Tmtc3 [Caerostris extrusa]